jgi:hypothetical protein
LDIRFFSIVQGVLESLHVVGFTLDLRGLLHDGMCILVRVLTTSREHIDGRGLDIDIKSCFRVSLNGLIDKTELMCRVGLIMHTYRVFYFTKLHLNNLLFGFWSLGSVACEAVQAGALMLSNTIQSGLSNFPLLGSSFVLCHCLIVILRENLFLFEIGDIGSAISFKKLLGIISFLLGPGILSLLLSLK